MDPHQEQNVPIFNDGIVDIPGNEVSFKTSLFLFPTIEKLKPIYFDISLFFHIQIFPHNGISEGGRIIAQCTEGNHFPTGYVTTLNMFSLYIVLQE